jgi:MFS family permease
MVESSGLLPIALGIGLAVISGSTVAGSRSRGGESRWRDPLFVFAALLIGVSLLGAALYLLGWSVEKGHKLPRAEARAENWLILTLALLVVALAARSAWLGFFYSEDALPWEPGRREHDKRLWGFLVAAPCVLLVGLGMDVVIFWIAKLKPGPSILLVVATVAVGLASAYGILRALSGGDPSPRAIAMSRHTQRKLLSALDGAAGRWQAIEVSTIGQLDRPLALKATVWITVRGMYWRLDDVSALRRYHDWAANHLLAPTTAVHTQRLMLANPTEHQDKHLAIEKWRGRRCGWTS